MLLPSTADFTLVCSNRGGEMNDEVGEVCVLRLEMYMITSVDVQHCTSHAIHCVHCTLYTVHNS